MKKLIFILCLCLFFTPTAFARQWGKEEAKNVKTNTTNFGTNLSIADVTVQQALDTLDDVIGGGGTGLPVVVSANTVLISNSTTWVAVGMNGDATLDSAGLLTIDESVAHSWTGIQDFVDVNITGAITVDSNTVNLSDTTDEYVLAFDTGTQTWRGVEAAAGTGDVTSVGDCLTGACDNIEFTTLSTTGDMTVGGSLTISDGGTPAIIGATNTAGMFWIADGTDYGEVAMSGNVTITATGVTTLNAMNAVTDEYVLSWEADTSKFEWVAQSGGASALGDLSDVGTATATAGNLLVADGSSFQGVAVSGDLTSDSTGDFSVVSISPATTLDISQDLNLNKGGGGCLMIRDSDDGGWTVVTVLNGSISSTIDLDGYCD